MCVCVCVCVCVFVIESDNVCVRFVFVSEYKMVSLCVYVAMGRPNCFIGAENVIIRLCVCVCVCVCVYRQGVPHITLTA